MANLPWPFDGWFVGLVGWFAKVTPNTGSISLSLPMIVMVVSIAALMIALGLGKKGRAFGVWINQENRMSLARMQVSLWTIVVLGAYAAMSQFNIGMLSEPFRALSILAAAAGSGSPSEKAVSEFVTFPSIPTMILAALGISVASTMASALIKTGAGPSVGLKASAQGPEQGGIGRFVDPSGDGSLEVRPTAEHASLADFFIGEHVNDKDLIDVSRLQNVVITVILVGGYASLLFGYVRDIAPDVIVSALYTGGDLFPRPVFPSLPDPGGVFTTLLAASHATYLISKGATAAQNK
jgi:hypothetical protein